MKRQITQFDNDRSGATIATPTCSSCCCCCCCLTTTIASSSILARRVNKEAQTKGVSDRLGLTILAALFLPVIGLIVWGLYALINAGVGECTQHVYESPFNDSYDYTYRDCTHPANAVLPALLFGVPVLVLSYIYKRVRMPKPILRSLIVTIVIWLAIATEAAIGATLILTGVGGIVYLCLVPFMVGVIHTLYVRSILKKDVTRKNVADAWNE